MASTVTAADLTVTISESFSLNGVAYGNSINKTFSTQGEVDQRIMEIESGEEASFTTIFSFSTKDGKGQGVTDDYAYFRITNLDDTNFVNLRITSGDSYWIKLKAGESFILMDNEMEAKSVSTSFSAFADITSISAKADTANVDIEYVIVTA